jgi:hypothetical protein
MIMRGQNHIKKDQLISPEDEDIDSPWNIGLLTIQPASMATSPIIFYGTYFPNYNLYNDMDPNFAFFEPCIIVITQIWFQLLMLMLYKRHTHRWPTKSGQTTVSGIYTVSTVCLSCMLISYSHYTSSVHMKCATIGASKTNYVSNTTNFNILNEQNIYILFF